MVDFGKRAGPLFQKPKIDPLEIYDSLDRASDKGPLRPAQEAVLSEWHNTLRRQRDLIVKLHTGQGKTLVGLLMLQSLLNENRGPALYLCPNNYLVEQTREQAEQFGIKTVVVTDSLPDAFLSGASILIATAQRLFNGLTKFKLNNQAEAVGAVVLDDSHACLAAIDDAYKIQLSKDHPVYKGLMGIFETALKEQGLGSYEEVAAGSREIILPVPYWHWEDRSAEVTSLLAKHRDDDEIKFAWPLLRDRLKDCLCLVSGTEIEIAPHIPDIDAFRSFTRADNRIFMSATTNDDSFFVKALGLSPKSIRTPLTYAKEKWSGEKMILIPSLVDPNNDRGKVVASYSVPSPARQYGVVVLCPSFKVAETWKNRGVTVAETKTIQSEITKLRAKNYALPLVLANRYDGVDLPDATCRVLILDGKPYAERLSDRYMEAAREDSATIVTRLAQKIEQGLGRNIRGEKDFGVVMLVGDDLVRAIRSTETRRFFSPQTRHQVEIGFQIGEMVKEEATPGTDSLQLVLRTARQCIDRDEGWKAYYISQMESMSTDSTTDDLTEIYVKEREADSLAKTGQFDRAKACLQALIDLPGTTRSDRGWYLQEMARYEYRRSKSESNSLQVRAHQINRYLMKPQTGMIFEPIDPAGSKRLERISTWVRRHTSPNDLLVVVNAMLQRLDWGTPHEEFESALNEIGNILGFICQRPDKEWKEGPDNLWGLQDGQYLLFECKNQTDTGKVEISKSDTGQMNNSISWFESKYPGAACTNLLITPAKQPARGAGFVRAVQLMRKVQLRKFRNNVKGFFTEICASDLQDISERSIQTSLKQHELDVQSILAGYGSIPSPPTA